MSVAPANDELEHRFDCRDKAEEILVAAARAGADLRSPAAICAEIRYRTAQPDPMMSRTRT